MQNTRDTETFTLSEIQLIEICKGFREFMTEYSDAVSSSHTQPGASPNILTGETGSQNLSVYLRKLEKLIEGDDETISIPVDFEHLMDFSRTLASAIETYFVRVEPHLNAVLFDLAAEFFPSYVKSDASEGLKRKRFSLTFFNLGEPVSLRQLDAKKTGQLIVISGVVTRTSDVRPELVDATFLCLVCNTEIPNMEQDFRFVFPKKCTRQGNEGLGIAACNNSSDFELIVKKSIFYDWQRASIQECANSIPSGCMPRTLEIILRNKLVETLKPGDRCSLTGALVAVPDVSQLYSNKEITRGDLARPNQNEIQGKAGATKTGPRLLNHRLVFIVYGVELDKMDNNLMEEGIEEGYFMSPKFEKNNLINRIAPHIYGHDDVKKGLLLMLLGGVEKYTKEKIHLRGTMNILLVGDPSTAKSQLLKTVLKLNPRTVYTSGKGTSAAGLTASVVRDEETGEFVIQAGAMMLADNGICCIDEFDKMDMNDQSAIHEAMEQQTITITKAGVHATMNSKASVLAACNPITGRYDRSKPLLKNVEISSPILSRFDLVFIMVDECDPEVDKKICSHVIDKRYNLTTNEGVEESDLKLTEMEFINFIRTASELKPRITELARKKIVQVYRQMRESDAITKNNCRTTARQLESLIRLSESCAKLYLSKEVTVEHVVEAADLLRKSIVMIRKKEVVLSLDLSSAQQIGNVGKEEGKEVEVVTENDEVTISFEEYSRIANSLAIWLQTEGMKTESEMIQWYISELTRRDLVSGAEATLKIIKITKMVIQRMVEIDNIFIREKDGNKVYYSLNPNYCIDEVNDIQKLENESDKDEKKKKTTDTRKRTKTTRPSGSESSVYDFEV